jgi:guanylate kinase
MAAEDEFDAVVVNDDIDRAAAELVRLIEAAE